MKDFKMPEKQIPEGINPNWLQEVQKNIEKEEYNITYQDRIKILNGGSAYQAPNRAQGFRTYFTKEGIKVIPRTEEEPTWELGLSLKEIFRISEIETRKEPSIYVEENRIEIDRGWIKEWYVNSKEGLEQGFTINTKTNKDTPLQIDLKLSGNLRPVFSEDGKAVDFYKDGGFNVLHYANLIVKDALGNELEGKFEPISGGIRISINDEGAVYPIVIDPLLTTPAWTSESNQANAYFGYSVSTAGDVNGDGYSDVIIGAYGYDNGETDEGRAYVFYGSSSGLSQTPSWTAESNQASACFGYSVSTAGDVNGDGYSDVIVGAYYYDNGEADEGRAYVYYGSASALSSTPNWTAESNQAGAYFGYSVSTAGDVNGDGYSDVIVGSHNYDNVETNEGRVFVYYGSANGLSLAPNWTQESNQTNAYFGRSVSTAGDVNGDGYSDTIVGAMRYDNGETDEGRAYVYYGSATGLSQIVNWTVESNQANANFGSSVSTAGDIQGDGYSDVVIGAPDYDNGETDEGRVFLYYGSKWGLSSAAKWTAESNQASAYLGTSVSTAGDVNGDGYSDVIIGVYSWDNIQTNEGSVWVYYGSGSGLSSIPNWMVESNQTGANYAGSVSTAGDVNGDGYSDIVVGSLRYDNGETDEGRAFVYYGSASGLSQTPNWTAESNQASAYFGISVSTAGDVNGDGYSDVIVGAYLYDNGETDEGRAFLYLGSDGSGVAFKAQQLKYNLSAPISAGGNAYEQKFRIGLMLKSPSGKVWSKLQWQIAPWGATFAPSVNPIQSDSSWYYNPVWRTVPINLSEDMLRYTWRARVKYHPAKSPFILWSRWFTIPYNGLYEADIFSTSVSDPYPPSGCVLPDEPCWLYSIVKVGTDITLNWQDPNQANQRTGWNIRRSNNASLPKDTWPFVGSNVVDMDQSTPNYQWTDHSGDDPGPGGIWYYQLTTYNLNCPAEGPF